MTRVTTTATATATEPRMNADDADRSRPGRGSARRDQKYCWFFLGDKGELLGAGLGARGLSLPPLTVRSRHARLPPAAPNTFGPGAGSPPYHGAIRVHPR